MPSITIPWTLPLLAKAITTPANVTSPKDLCFVHEYDADLGINWWGECENEFGWELDSITIEWNTPLTRFIVTKDSDPEFWAIVMRGFKADELALSEKIMDRIHEALSDEVYEAVDMGR